MATVTGTLAQGGRSLLQTQLDSDFAVRMLAWLEVVLMPCLVI